MWAMSAWKPSVCGRSTISSSWIIRFQLCMPPQQISPSAASRSPWSSAILQASRKVSAIRFWLPSGSSHQASTPQAESIRTAPCGPHAQLAQPLGDAAALADLAEELLAGPRRSPMAEPPPVGGQTGATTVPISRFRARALSASALISSSLDVDVDVRMRRGTGRSRRT